MIDVRVSNNTKIKKVSIVFKIRDNLQSVPFQPHVVRMSLYNVNEEVPTIHMSLLHTTISLSIANYLVGITDGNGLSH